jgi:hypothetical protein
MIRRRFVQALSGAILTTLLGVKAWRLEDAEWEVNEPVDGWTAYEFSEGAEPLWDAPVVDFEWSNFEAQDEYTARWVTHHSDRSKTYGEPMRFRIHTNGQPIPADWS